MTVGQLLLTGTPLCPRFCLLKNIIFVGMKMNTEDAFKFLSRVQQVDAEMPIQQIMCLLVISQSEEGMSLTDIAKRVNISMTTASRYIGSLGKINRRKEEGLNYIESYEDPMERRKKIIRLSKKGEIALRRMLGE